MRRLSFFEDAKRDSCGVAEDDDFLRMDFGSFAVRDGGAWKFQYHDNQVCLRSYHDCRKKLSAESASTGRVVFERTTFYLEAPGMLIDTESSADSG